MRTIHNDPDRLRTSDLLPGEEIPDWPGWWYEVTRDGEAVYGWAVGPKGERMLLWRYDPAGPNWWQVLTGRPGQVAMAVLFVFAVYWFAWRTL